MENIKQRNYAFDLLKCFCIVGVICIHVIAEVGLNNTVARNIINIIIRTCVPLFFMMSGYFIYDRISLNYIKKYILKLLVIYIISVCFYGIVNKNLIEIFLLLRNIFSINILKSLIHFYYAISPIQYHLWYLLDYIILIPIIYFIVRFKQVNTILKLSFILNILGVLISVKFSATYARDAIFLGLFYMNLGYYIKQNEEYIVSKFKRNNKIIYLFTVLLLIICYIEQYIYIKFLGHCGDYFITTIPLTLFIFIYCLTSRMKGISKINKLVSQNTLSIYIIHLFILIRLIRHFSFSNTLLDFVTLVSAVFALSILFVWIMSILKNKLLKG